VNASDHAYSAPLSLLKIPQAFVCGAHDLALQSAQDLASAAQ
jgi:hypothetical protein